MASLNLVVLMGRVTKELELHYTAGSTPVLSVPMAIDDGYGDTKSTIWMDVTFWDKQAETLVKWVKKGDLLTIQGKLEQREQIVNRGAPNERKERKTKVRGITFTLMPNNRQRGDGESPRHPAQSQRQQQPADGGQGFPPGMDEEDEIPF